VAQHRSLHSASSKTVTHSKAQFGRAPLEINPECVQR